MYALSHAYTNKKASNKALKRRQLWVLPVTLFISEDAAKSELADSVKTVEQAASRDGTYVKTIWDNEWLCIVECSDGTQVFCISDIITARNEAGVGITSYALNHAISWKRLSKKMPAQRKLWVATPTLYSSTDSAHRALSAAVKQAEYTAACDDKYVDTVWESEYLCFVKCTDCTRIFRVTEDTPED